MSMVCSKNFAENKKKVFGIWVLAVVLLIMSAIAYKFVGSQYYLVGKQPIKLPVPLNEFPMVVDNWKGTNVPISETVLKVAANDDYLSRFYKDNLTNEWANIYLAYSARPRTMLGHRPKVCYPANGWSHSSTDHAKVISKSGVEIPCLIHRFYKPAARHDEIVVLNYYIVNGRLTDDESVFGGIEWRTPNIGGNIARYVTQVQISSALENSVRAIASDMTDLIMDFFPDEYGKVLRAENSDIAVNNPK